MVSFKQVLAGVVAASMVVLPGVAHAAGASKLSISNAAPVSKDVRSGVRTSKKSKQEGGSVAVLVLAGAAVVGGVIAATSGGSESD